MMNEEFNYTPEARKRINELKAKLDEQHNHLIEVESDLVGKSVEFDNALNYSKSVASERDALKKQNDALIEAICLLAKARRHKCNISTFLKMN